MQNQDTTNRYATSVRVGRDEHGIYAAVVHQHDAVTMSDEDQWFGGRVRFASSTTPAMLATRAEDARGKGQGIRLALNASERYLLAGEILDAYIAGMRALEAEGA